MKTFHLTLKMTTAQIVKTSVTNNSLYEDYPHPELDSKDDYRSGSQNLSPTTVFMKTTLTLSLTIKMTTAQVVKTSVTNESL